MRSFFVSEWAYLYAERHAKQRRIAEYPHIIHRAHAHEFKKFQWTYFHFTRSKREMSNNFHPVYGRLRHIMTLDGNLLNDLYTDHEQSGNLEAVESSIYSLLWSSHKWFPYVIMCVTDIFTDTEPLPLSVWAYGMCQKTIFITICKYLDWSAIIALSQVCTSLENAYKTTRNHTIITI